MSMATRGRLVRKMSSVAVVAAVVGADGKGRTGPTGTDYLRVPRSVQNQIVDGLTDGLSVVLWQSHDSLFQSAFHCI